MLGTVIDLDYLIHLFHEHPCARIAYHLDGKMFAVVEGGMSYYTITVDGDKVTSEEFIPDATYVDEFYACEESEDT